MGKKKKSIVPLTILPQELIMSIASYLPSESVLKLSLSAKEFSFIPKDNTNILETLKTLSNSYFHNKVHLDDTYIHECSTVGWLVFNYKNYLEENSSLKLKEDYHETLFLHCGDELFSSEDVEKEIKKLNLYQQEISQIFNPRNFDRFFCYYDTPEFQTYSRLFSYHLFEIADTIPVYKNLFLFHPRKLNEIEKELFEATGKYQGKKIVSESSFFKNFDDNFKFNTWKSFINWDNFFLVGGSVLKCILENSFKGTSSDIDFFFIGDDYNDYESIVNEMRLAAKDYFDKSNYPHKMLHEMNRTGSDDRDTMYIRNLFLEIDGKQLKFQFIWYDCEATHASMNPQRILNIFDIDCCQVGFDGTDVRCSLPFVQSINTGTFLNYKFVNSKKDMMNFYPRTKKYRDRGFTLIYSKKFEKSILKNKMNVEKEDKDIRDKYAGFLINNDSMGVCNQFIKLFQ